MADALEMTRTPDMTDRIEKEIFINAPQSRVWRALTDHREFGAWFGAILEESFTLGGRIRGSLTIPGFEHVVLDAKIVEITPESRFVYTWHPHAIDPNYDYSGESPTTVTFTLTPEGAGTRLRATETGFDAIPTHRKAEALRDNTRGWEYQLQSIARHSER